MGIIIGFFSRYRGWSTVVVIFRVMLFWDSVGGFRMDGVGTVIRVFFIRLVELMF